MVLVNDTAREIVQLIRQKGLRIYEIRRVFDLTYRLLESSEASFAAYRKERKPIS